MTCSGTPSNGSPRGATASSFPSCRADGQAGKAGRLGRISEATPQDSLAFAISMLDYKHEAIVA